MGITQILAVIGMIAGGAVVVLCIMAIFAPKEKDDPYKDIIDSERPGNWGGKKL